MKKLLVLGLTLTVIFAFFAAFSMALAEEGATTIKTTEIKAAPAKGCCAGSAKACTPGAACTPEQMAACSAKLGLSADECKTYCQADKYQVVRMSVTGMTDPGAEEAVKTTLAATPGVEKVGRVSAADGLAVVVFNNVDPSASVAAMKALELKGFKAEVATLEVMSTQADVKTAAPKKGCAATCGAAAAASCGAKKESCAPAKTTEAETKKTDK